ncbi:hypothetical protein V2J09_011541 [Rumex salicifolius]
MELLSDSPLRSLKYLLEQKVSTPFRHMWLSKLMGYSYEIQYKQGKENVAADALSRVSDAQLLQITLTQADQNFFDSVKALWQSDPACANIISDLTTDPSLHPAYSFCTGELRRKGKLVIDNDEAVKTHIFKWLHDSALGGHSGRDATARRIASLFYWPRMNAEIQNYVRNCSVCQRNKTIQCSPYEIIYGQPPPLHLPYLPGESSSAVVDRSLRKREELISGNPKEPEAILERKMVKRHNAAVTKVLVQWKGADPSQATWEFYQDFIAKFPNFHP